MTRRCSVPATGKTFNPLPWSRPMRGFYPLTIAYSDAGPNGFIPYGDAWRKAFLRAPNPDICTGSLPLPRGVDMRSADPQRRGSAARTQLWNAFIRAIASRWMSRSALATSALATDESTLTTTSTTRTAGATPTGSFCEGRAPPIDPDWPRAPSADTTRCRSPSNRPSKTGLLLKGAYTLSKALNEADDDGWVGLTWTQPSQLSRNYALAGYDRTHILQMGFVYELPFAKDSEGPGRRDQELAGQRHRLWRLAGRSR